MTSKEILLYLHQLPQNIIGWCLTRKPKRQCKTIANDGEEVYLTTVSHEHGHQKQSMYLGWLYLLIIGLPSALRNITDIVFS